MSRLPYPRQPSEVALQIARQIVGKRFTTDHKDYNGMLLALREQGLDHQLGFYGEDSITARPVVEFVAEQNLRTAPLRALERKIATMERHVRCSVAKSHSKVDIARLGGPGAAGRVRDQANDSIRRNITEMYRQRLVNEIKRREEEHAA